MKPATIPLEQHLSAVRSLTDQISYLKEQLEWFKRQIFGQKADKFIEPQNEQQLCFEGFDKLASVKEASKQNVRGHQRSKEKTKGADTITLPADIPVERQVLDLPEEAKICPATGKPLKLIGEEITSKLAHRPGSYFIKQIVRLKYGLPKGEGVAIANLPPTLLDRCQADDSLLAEIIVNKFGDHLKSRKF